MRVERETQELPCILTAEEMSQKATTLVRHEDEVASLEVELKQTKESFKERIDGHTAEMKELRRMIRTKTEDRPVECLIVPMPHSGYVMTIRIDTAAEVFRRPMTDNEKLQPNLFDATEDKEAANGEETVERDEHSHLIQAVALNDILFQIDVDLAPGELVSLSDTDLDKARNWALKTLNIKDDKERKEKAENPPKVLKELLVTVEQQRAAAAERAALQQRCLSLLIDAGEHEDPEKVESWSIEQLNEASDYAQASLDGKTNVPRPEFLTPVKLEGPESDEQPTLPDSQTQDVGDEAPVS